MQETVAYITIKDHKGEFTNKIPCCLINPSKSNIGEINKAILDTINKDVVRSTEINQWKNVSNLLDWYANYADKKNSRLFNLTLKIFIPQ